MTLLTKEQLDKLEKCWKPKLHRADWIMAYEMTKEEFADLIHQSRLYLQLRELVEKAPHGSLCATTSMFSTRANCNCWKREALSPKHSVDNQDKGE